MQMTQTSSDFLHFGIMPLGWIRIPRTWMDWLTAPKSADAASGTTGQGLAGFLPGSTRASIVGKYNWVNSLRFISECLSWLVICLNWMNKPALWKELSSVLNIDSWRAWEATWSFLNVLYLRIWKARDAHTLTHPTIPLPLLCLWNVGLGQVEAKSCLPTIRAVTLCFPEWAFAGKWSGKLRQISDPGTPILGVGIPHQLPAPPDSRKSLCLEALHFDPSWSREPWTYDWSSVIISW